MVVHNGKKKQQITIRLTLNLIKINKMNNNREMDNGPIKRHAINSNKTKKSEGEPKKEGMIN